MENKQPITITTKNTENIENTLYDPREEEEQEELKQFENEISQNQLQQIEEQLRNEQQFENQFQQQLQQQNAFFQISEMSKEKRNLIRQIRKYRQLFDKNIVTMKDLISDEKLVNYDEKMLQNLLIEVDEEISCVQSAQTLNSFIETALTMYEKTFSMFNVDINGFKSDLLSDESFNNSI